MEIVASCSLEEANKFNGNLVIQGEDKKKVDKVSLNIVVEDGNNDIFSLVNSNVKYITFINKPCLKCPDNFKGKVYNEYSLEEYLNQDNNTLEGITNLVRLPDSYPKDSKFNLRDLMNMCKDDPTLRFIGGKLLGIEGLRIGRSDKGKEKMSPVFDEVYDSFIEVSLDKLDGIQEVIRRNSKKMDSSSRERKPKEKKVSKKVLAFNSLFGGNVEEF